MKHEWKELVERDFLLADLPASVAEALEVRTDLVGTEKRLAERQHGVDHIEAAMQPGTTGLQRFVRNDLCFHICFPYVRYAAAALLMFVLVP